MSGDVTELSAEAVIDGLLRARAAGAIEAFVAEVRESAALAEALCRVGTRPATVVAFAARHGHDFTVEELEAWIETRLAMLPAWMRERRQAWLARREAGELPDPVAMSLPTPARLHDIPWTEGFALDRRAVLAGEVVVLRAVPALVALAAHLAEHLETAFAPGSPRRAHLELAAEARLERACAAHLAQTGDAAIPGLVAGVLAALGVPREAAMWEWPGCRLIPPAPSEDGSYRDHGTGPVGFHRDTWYGSPQHQINLWSPLWPMAPGAAPMLQPACFRRSVANSSAGYDLWLNALGLTLAPRLLEQVERRGMIAPHLAPGDALIFAAHQLHGSGVNAGPEMRGSLEFRLLVETDTAWAPPNIDCHGFGEIMDNWHDGEGRPVHR